MTLSIITINYNNCDGLKRTIDSVVSQTFTDYEWIVIDGGSNDGSFELIEKYQKHFTYWVSEPDSGIYQAMNKGIAHANGDWYIFLNSGDWLFNNEVLSMVFSSNHDANILYGDVMYHWPDKRGLELEKKPETLSLYYFYTENKFSHLPICITNFAQDGISTHLNESHLAERRQVIEEYIPSYIIPDLERLRIIDERKKHIASHRSYQSIMSRAEKRIIRMEKIVKLIEKLRSK